MQRGGPEPAPAEPAPEPPPEPEPEPEQHIAGVAEAGPGARSLPREEGCVWDEVMMEVMKEVMMEG